jgi:hypothetical protein
MITKKKIIWAKKNGDDADLDNIEFI